MTEPSILPVLRSKEKARRFYDSLSRWYDCIARFERRYTLMALERLAIKNGEAVLEIGFGTGVCIERIAQSAGKEGEVHGIDISPRMLEVTRKRLQKTGLLQKTTLVCGDATGLPYNDNTFDAVFMSFTLELFDTPEIPVVMQEVKRVLIMNGRLGVVSLSRDDAQSYPLKIYEWAHTRLPHYFDCRPIYVEKSLIHAGFYITSREKASLFGLPLEIVTASKRTNKSE